MAAQRSFICDKDLCYNYKTKVCVGPGFFCKRKAECQGEAILNGTAEPDKETPFWQRQSFLAGLATLFALAFIGFAFFRPVKVEITIPAGVTGPPGPQGVAGPAGAAGTLEYKETPAVSQGAAVIPSPAPLPDARFEVDTLIACGERLLSLYRALSIAEETSETKYVNGQRQTELGRTAGESLERLQLTYQNKKMFDDVAASKRQQIMKESSRYLAILDRLHPISAEAVRQAFEAAVRERQGAPKSNLIAPSLARQHWQTPAKLDQICEDYEQRAYGLPAQ